MSCVSVQSDPRPRRLGDVDGWTPARSPAITFKLTQALITRKRHTGTLSIKHVKFMGRQGRDSRVHMVLMNV